MSEIEILEENTISLAELKEKLEKIPQKEEPGFRAKKMTEYLNNFVKIKSKDASALRNKLEGLNLLRLNDRCITKLIDVHPTEGDSLRLVLASENITVKQEDLNKILECLK